MIPILVVTHGPLAKSILESSEMLIGKSNGVETLSLSPGDSFEGFQQRLISKASTLDEGAGVLVLADLLGGSPYNAAARSMLHCNIECLTGLNLSMLLTAVDQREYCNLKQLVKECKSAAISNITDVRQLLSADNSDDEDE